MPSVTTNFTYPNPCQAIASDPDNIKMAIQLLRTLHQEENNISKRVKQLIKEKPDIAKEIFTVDVYGWTFAHACVLRGTLSLLKLILGAGIDANCRLGDLQDGLSGHCTLLHLAAYRGDYKIVQLLLSYNAKLDAVDSFGEYPLAYAKKYQHESLYSCLQYPTKTDNDTVDGVEYQKKHEQSKLTAVGKVCKILCVVKRKLK